MRNVRVNRFHQSQDGFTTNLRIADKREKYNDYLAHYDTVEDMLATGARRAREIARPVLERAKDAIFCRK